MICLILYLKAQFNTYQWHFHFATQLDDLIICISRIHVFLQRLTFSLYLCVRYNNEEECFFYFI